jgi:hypothetical protein
MSYQIIPLFLFIAIGVFLSIAGKKLNKKVNWTLTALGIIIFFLLPFLPRQLFGRWNSISRLDGKVISEIHLLPSEPNWKVNLVGNVFILSDKKQIDTITQLLRKTTLYFPSHPIRIWETKMIFITASKDTFEIEINKTNNDYNGTVIQTQSNECRKDEIGSYLEKVTKYRQPVYSDTARNRNL